MEHLLEFGTKRVKPIVRRLFDMKDVIYDREWLQSANNFELYYMYRELSLSKNDALTMKEHGLRYDITIIPPCMLGCEFVKTAGHYHPGVPGTTAAFPEIYEVLSGEANYIMQQPDGDNKIKDVILIKAKPGDKVLIPPGYGHLTVNTSNKVLKMANWVARDFESLYEPFREKRGGAYYFLENGLMKNPNYSHVPEIRILDTNTKKLGLKKSQEMYGLVRDITKLDFLTKPDEFDWLFEDNKSY